MPLVIKRCGFLFLLLLLGCGEGVYTIQPTSVHLKIVIDPDVHQKVLEAPTPSGISTVTLDVTASGMAAISKSISVSAGDTPVMNVDVPSGPIRLFTATALNSSGTPQFRGSTTVNLNGGSQTVVITLSLAGGTPDTSFGSSGVATATFGTSGDLALVTAFQPDGKVVAAGFVGSGTSSDFVVVRYSATGSVDTTFGTGGRVTTGINTIDLPVAIAIQSDGKIVVVGSAATSTTSDFAIVRYTSTGALDTTFGSSGTGIVTTDFSGRLDAAATVVLQSDGKIVVGGVSISSTGNKDFALARYTSAGALDTSFGSGGTVTTDIETGFGDAITRLILQGSNIIAVGSSNNSAADKDFALARYTSAGVLDTTFGSSGKTKTDFGTNGDGATAVAFFSDGRLLVAGTSSTLVSNIPTSSDFALARYSADGVLDTSFGTNGKVTTNFNVLDAITSVVFQSDGKIVASGSAGASLLSSDFALARYSADGALDTDFGTSGKVTTDVSTTIDLVMSLAIQSDGKIAVSGFSISGASLALARYNP